MKTVNEKFADDISRFAASIAVEPLETPELQRMKHAEDLLWRAFEMGKAAQAGTMRTKEEIEQVKALLTALQPWNSRDIAVLNWVLGGPSPEAPVPDSVSERA
jgi:hypothetical protein